MSNPRQILLAYSIPASVWVLKTGIKVGYYSWNSRNLFGLLATKLFVAEWDNSGVELVARAAEQKAKKEWTIQPITTMQGMKSFKRVATHLMCPVMVAQLSDAKHYKVLQWDVSLSEFLNFSLRIGDNWKWEELIHWFPSFLVVILYNNGQRFSCFLSVASSMVMEKSWFCKVLKSTGCRLIKILVHLRKNTRRKSLSFSNILTCRWKWCFRSLIRRRERLSLWKSYCMMTLFISASCPSR
jgi:hypothetical protein